MKIKNKTDETIIIQNSRDGIYATNPERQFFHSLINGLPTDYQIRPHQEKKLNIFFKNATQIREITFKISDNKEIKINI